MREISSDAGARCDIGGTVMRAGGVGHGDVVESTRDSTRIFAGGAAAESVDRTLMIPVDAGGCEEDLGVACSLGSAGLEV